MTKEDKKLLLTDLCARLPYGVKFFRESWNYEWDQELSVIEVLKDIDKDGFINNTKVYTVEDIKPYLRSLSSMTDEEKENLNLIVDEFGNKWMDSESPLDKWKAAFWEYSEATNYLNSIHIDYRGLIEKGLALKAPEGMYKEEQQ